MTVTGVDAVILIVFVGSLYLISQSKRTPLPPGPRGQWVVGNVADMPKEKEWETFTAWKKVYGDVVFLKLLRTPVVILNSFKTAHDLLDRRSKVYSGRPFLPMAVDLCGYQFGITLYQNTPWHRYERMMFETYFRTQVVENYTINLHAASVLLLKLLTEEPKGFMEHIKLAVGSNILDICYGHPAQSFEDPTIQTAETVSQNFGKAILPGRWLVDVFPILKYVPEWFPGAEFKRIAKEFRETIKKHVDPPYEKVKVALAEGSIKPCVATFLIENDVGDHPGYEQSAKEILSAAYAAGIDTSSTLLQSLLLHLMLYPSVQKQMQREIDLLCPDRLPAVSDRPSLVYLECVIREVTRIRPPIPQGIPHRLDRDDVYEGKWIPKDTVVIPNIWGMLRDEEMYDEPDKFKPERHMLNGKINPEVPDPRTMIFGFGRRICPGRGFADYVVFTYLARVLKVFDILPPLDEKGRGYIPDVKYGDGLFHAPRPFPCRIVPRSKDTMEMVQSELDHA